MIQRLSKNGQYRSSKNLTLAAAIAAVLVSLPSQQVEAALNNSGRYVVPDENGVWRAIDDSTLNIAGSVFYPSWYLGVDLSQTKWDADAFESKSTGAGLVVGNHFSPHLRWELRHRYQEPKAEYTGVEGQRHTVSSLVLDYLVAEPADGFSPVLRGGVAQANGDDFADDQSDATALLGLGMQWREDRWFVRMMLEQAGEDQQWASLTVAGYLGGTQEPKKTDLTLPSKTEGTVVAPVTIEQAPKVEQVAIEPPPSIAETPDDVVVEPAVIAEPVITAEPATIVAQQTPVVVAQVDRSSLCGKVFSTRVMNDISFVDSGSDQLTARSVQQLAQIGASYARRSYVAVDVDISSPSADLAERRANTVMAALNANGELDDRIVSQSQEGAGHLTLSMKDMRLCNK